MTDLFPLKENRALKNVLFFLAGIFIVVPLWVEDARSEEMSTPGSENLECPEDSHHLRYCAFKVFLSENPSIEMSEELSNQLNKAVRKLPHAVVSSCPKTPAQLGNCYAKQQVDVLKQYIDRSITSEFRSLKKNHPETSPIPKLGDFNKAKNRWFERFKSSPIPIGAYQAHYFDSTNPTKVIKTETVPNVAIQYAWSQGNGFTIDSENFGGFWVGSFIVNQPNVFGISIAASHSQARVIIDGHEIPTRDTTKIFLEAGTYQVEVEFLNNWHTTDFAMNIEKEIKTFSLAEAQNELGQVSEDYDLWYVGIYESKRTNRNATVFIQKQSRPVVLVLSSYSQVNWIIKNQAGAKILYILHSSYAPGTSVTAANYSGKTIKLKRNSLPYEYTIDAQCNDVKEAIFHCENIDGLKRIDASIQSLVGKTVNGFSGGYAIDTISVPNHILTDEYRAKVYKSYDNIRTKRREFEDTQKIQNVFK